MLTILPTLLAAPSSSYGPCLASRLVTVTRTSYYSPNAPPDTQATCSAAIALEGSPTRLLTEFEGMASGTHSNQAMAYLTPCNTTSMNPSGLRTTLILRTINASSTSTSPPFKVVVNGVPQLAAPPSSMTWNDSSEAHGMYGVRRRRASKLGSADPDVSPVRKGAPPWPSRCGCGVALPRACCSTLTIGAFDPSVRSGSTPWPRARPPTAATPTRPIRSRGATSARCCRSRRSR
jgi:hypothetical protein